MSHQGLGGGRLVIALVTLVGLHTHNVTRLIFFLDQPSPPTMVILMVRQHCHIGEKIILFFPRYFELPTALLLCAHLIFAVDMLISSMYKN